MTDAATPAATVPATPVPRAADPGRWTVVTGASSGIGAALARAFAVQGDGLVLVARRRDRLDVLAAELAVTHGTPVRIYAFDLEDPDAPLALMRAIEDDGVAIHTLINNAGFGLRGRFASLPAARQLAMVQLNVAALTSLCRHVMPGLIARKAGGILNVASLAAFQAGPNMAVYYASKAYVLSLSEALHEEAKPHGVTVTALCPGPVETEFAAVADLEGSSLFRTNVMTAAEVAKSGLAGYRAGRAIVVPGAMTAFAPLAARLLPRALMRRLAGRLQAVE